MQSCKRFAVGLLAALSLTGAAQQVAPEQPGLRARGIDHIGITVPNLDAASHFLE